MPKKYHPLLFFVVMFLAFDLAYSLLSTCQVQYQQIPNSSHQYNCTAFGGSIPWIVGITLHTLSSFLEAYEHPLIAGFTIVLALFTARLWWSTEKLWQASESQLAVAQRPWLRMSCDAQRMRFAPTGISITVNFSADNVGNTPALYVIPRQRPFVAHGIYNIQEAMRKFSEECRANALNVSAEERRHPGDYVFPGEE